MPQKWTYSTRSALKDTDAPSLSLEAHTDASPSFGNNCTFATSQLALELTVSVDGEIIRSPHLATSAAVREMTDWLTKNASLVGIDALGVPTTADGGVTVPLYVATRTTRAQALVIDSSSTRISTLSCLALCLDFVSAPPSSSSASQSQSTSQGSSQEGLLINQVLAQDPTPLHFSISLILHSALAKLFRELSKVFPLCFNPSWVSRLTNDLPAFLSISKSLTRILDPGTLVSNGQLSLDNLRRSRDLQQDLIRVVSPIPSDNYFSSVAVDQQARPLSSSEAIEKSLLLLAKQSQLIDPVKLANDSSNSAKSTIRGSGRRKRAVATRTGGEEEGPEYGDTTGLKRSQRVRKPKLTEEEYRILLREEARVSEEDAQKRRKNKTDSGEMEIEEREEEMLIDPSSDGEAQGTLEDVENSEGGTGDEEMLLCEEAEFLAV